jgi:hypothetical protein
VPTNLAGTLFPNPVTQGEQVQLYYMLTSPADEVKVKLYTAAFRKVLEQTGPSTLPGVTLVTLDWSQTGLANGLYYVVVASKTGGKETRQVMKLLVLR